MPQLSRCIKLSDELKIVPIQELVATAKSLVHKKIPSQSTVRHYDSRFKDLERSSALFDAKNLSEKFITWYIEEGTGKSRGLASSSVQRKTLLNFIAAAINAPPVFIYEQDSERIHNMRLRESLSAYEQHLKKEYKSNETIKSYLQTATKLLLYLDRVKKYELSEVTTNNIQEFIAELSAKWSPRSMRIIPSHLKTFLDFTDAPADVILFSSFRTPQKSNPVRAMSLENIEALWGYVEDDTGDIRSKAMLAILLTTGMRPVDITKLKLDDIDWCNDSISFIQSKTGVGVNIKLFPAIGSAIARYMTEKRPKGTGEKYVFLTKQAPYRKLDPSICNEILKAALKTVGVAFVPDGLHCPRAVRRSLVSRMIAKGVSVQKAAASIGHVDETSVELYTELDVEKMRAICLPIPTQMKRWCVFNV